METYILIALVCIIAAWVWTIWSEALVLQDRVSKLEQFIAEPAKKGVR